MRKAEGHSITHLELSELSSSNGIFLCGAIGADDARITLSAERDRLTSWQEEGFAGEMKFMTRPSALLTDVDRLIKASRSVATFIVPYSAPSVSVPPLPKSHGKIARYAWGEDYHEVIPSKLRSLVNEVEARLQSRNSNLGPISFRAFSDAVPLLERALAHNAALGFVGKNTMLIRPRVGSYFFIAEIVWDVLVIDIPPKASYESRGIGCKSCTTCLTACPTRALVKDKVLDARRCISYLTIESVAPSMIGKVQLLGIGSLDVMSAKTTVRSIVRATNLNFLLSSRRIAGLEHLKTFSRFSQSKRKMTSVLDFEEHRF